MTKWVEPHTSRRFEQGFGRMRIECPECSKMAVSHVWRVRGEVEQKEDGTPLIPTRSVRVFVCEKHGVFQLESDVSDLDDPKFETGATKPTVIEDRPVIGDWVDKVDQLTGDHRWC